MKRNPLTARIRPQATSSSAPTCQPVSREVAKITSGIRAVDKQTGVFRNNPLQQKPMIRYSTLVERVLATVDRDLFESDLNVKSLKVRCHITDNNISSIFRSQVGTTIKDYIEASRMKAVKVFLDQGTPTICELAYRVGYEHIQTFYRAFRRHFACTPGAYKHRRHLSLPAEIPRPRMEKS